ncbi:anhydro-N-acetylmuramic acid kinase [Myxococcota bacterium]|nr:anhydro-N-acetylmuramic acid kinase [Myxococcota bacterium]
MSGTSADGVDAALVEWPDDADASEFSLLGFLERPLDPDLRSRLFDLVDGAVAGDRALEELAALDVLLGRCFAEAALAVIAETGVDPGSIDAVSSHGQTVAHHPQHGASLQIGSPAVIAERTGLLTVADFRPRDLAAGGEGAPLAPFFHWVALCDAQESRAVLNLGGIANVTWLPAGCCDDQVLAFDIGPANALLDSVVTIASRGRESMDRDGQRAARGRPNEALLVRLLDDPYLQRPPPKSTGRERYGRAQAQELVRACDGGSMELDDLVATLVAFTVRGVADAFERWLGAGPDRVLVGGGGARNPTVMDGLRRALPGVGVEPLEAAGVPSAAAEAMAFALMGRNTLLGVPNHLPQCTGAERAAVLGSITPGRSGGVPRQG